jgi:hypothetical protein
MATIVFTAKVSNRGEQPSAKPLEKRVRRITFNGKPLTGQQLLCLESFERSLGLRLPDRDYWCDPLELWTEGE